MEHHSPDNNHSPNGQSPPDLMAGKSLIWLALPFIILFVLAMILYFGFDGIRPDLTEADVPRVSVDSEFRNQVTIEQGMQGHYVFRGKIGNKPVKFLLDTGATTVAIPAALMDYLGLQKGQQRYVSTANGTAVAYQTIIPSISVGEIYKTQIEGAILEGMDGDYILLGMSFLKDVEIRQKNGVLTLVD
ncbi:MAG: TIGR02281 family clan AA aspartic protease [Kangiellaceae bacterium]|nr:TIGR02281 family clan AA aspartic protease [Kangiellaceae bacterium]|tara:strand:+ start:3436 stop:3999 length:564 start_codon:yes stop_codon:yes gene_type:complete